jgi:hypothetical protein
MENKETLRPNCYDCIYRRPIPGDVHSQCVHPFVKNSKERGVSTVVSIVDLLKGESSGVMKELNISGHSYGIRNNWFFWPINFDPAWLVTCNGFEKRTLS